MIDEARIWNTARSQSDIIADMFHEITSGAGLLARWSLNQRVGTFANNSVGSGAYGTLTSGPTWVGGTPFVLTARFQDGVTGYTGAVDTYLLESSPAASFGAQPDLGWDLEDTNGDQATRKYGLMRFDNIFGSGAGQIPAGASIVSAVLTYTVYNNSADPFNLNEVAIDWPESVTYNGFGSTAGVQAAD